MGSTTKFQSQKRSPLLNYVRHVLANSEANNNYKSIPDIMGDVKHLCANRKGWREIVRNMKL